MKKPGQRPPDPARDSRPNRPKNREVENEMIGTREEEGEPPHPATEPEPKTDDAAAPRGAKGR